MLYIVFPIRNVNFNIFQREKRYTSFFLIENINFNVFRREKRYISFFAIGKHRFDVFRREKREYYRLSQPENVVKRDATKPQPQPQPQFSQLT